MPLKKSNSKTGVAALTPEEKLQGSGGNIADRLKRIFALRAREALVNVRDSLLPDIPLYIAAPSNGEAIGGFPSDIAQEEKPASRLAPLVALSVLAGFILLRIFR